jgi:nucleobase:cation symporter-1, NCS1 family
VVIVAPLLPGLAQAISPNTVHLNAGLTHLYYINWEFGFATSIVCYYILMKVFPAPETMIAKPVLVFGESGGDSEGEVNVIHESELKTP